MNSLNQGKLRVILLALLCMPILCSAMFAQSASEIFTVAAATDNASRLGSRRVQVRGHFWLGKEGSMIYDSGYKAILRLQYSDAFNAKHDFHELLGKARKSDLVTITGCLHLEPNGKLVLIADDIQFAENLR
jgi:hypothetical protein